MTRWKNGEYNYAYNILAEIPDYKDSEKAMKLLSVQGEQVTDYDEKVKILEELGDYRNAKNLLFELKYDKVAELVNSENYAEAFKLFNTLEDQSDPSGYIDKMYQTAVDYENDRKFSQAAEIFVILDKYEDSAEHVDKIFEQACTYMKDKKYNYAAAVFMALGDYKDSKDNVDKLYEMSIKYTEDEKYTEAIPILKNLVGYKKAKDKLDDIHQKASELMKDKKYDDAIIYLRMPQSTGADVDSQDKKFISKISETVSAEYSKEMLFWIVNENGSNKEICDAYCNKIKAEDAKISEKIIVNCRDKKAVEDKLLKPILTKMKDRIQYVDEIIVKKANDFGTAVFNEYSALASEINNLFVGCASEDLQTEMLPRIRDAYETELLNGIRELCLGKYAELREEECKPLYEAIDNTLKNIFDFIPDKDIIIERYVRRGSNDAHESLRMCNNIARLGIIDSFNKLDIVLNDIVKGMKREVVEIMANKAFLCKITPYGNNDDPDEWIKRFISDITLTKHYPKIEKALNDFVNFNCSVQGFLIHEVRDKLYSIDQQVNNKTDTIESKYPHYEEIADEIINILKEHLYWIAKAIRERVSALSSVPNKALFAAIYDLYDRLTWEDRKKNDEVSVPDISVRDEWEKLYRNYIQKIWAEEYDAHMSNQKISKDWRYITETISEMNKPECFKITF